MHKIYFENRCLVICSPDEPALHDPNAILFRPGQDIDIHLHGAFHRRGSFRLQWHRGMQGSHLPRGRDNRSAA